mgnify:CR=1 FL=1
MTSCGHCQRSCLTYDGDGASFGHTLGTIARRLRRRAHKRALDCLLLTSAAADEGLSEDLGTRRNTIHTKNQVHEAADNLYY